VLKHKWRALMKAAGKPTGKPNLVTGPVQVVKFACYLDVELGEIPLERGRIGVASPTLYTGILIMGLIAFWQDAVRLACLQKSEWKASGPKKFHQSH
jgi:hypothetical protein